MPFNPEQLSIRHIDVVSFQIKNEPMLKAPDLNEYRIDSEQTVEVGFNQSLNTAKVTIDYNIVPVKDEVSYENLSAQFVIEFYVFIENYEELVSEEGKNLQVDNHLYVNLIAVSFSTGRGLIYSKLQLTHLENVILPVIDPKKMIKG